MLKYCRKPTVFQHYIEQAIGQDFKELESGTTKKKHGRIIYNRAKIASLKNQAYMQRPKPLHGRIIYTNKKRTH